MKKRPVCPIGVACGLALGLVASCNSSPETVADGFQDALEAGDIETAVALFAPDAVLRMDGKEATTLEEIRAALEGALEVDATFTSRKPHETVGDEVVWTTRLRNDEYVALEVAPVELRIGLRVRDGRIVACDWMLTPEYEATVDFAITARARFIAEELAARITDGEVEGIRELFAPEPEVKWDEVTVTDEAGFEQWLATVASEETTVETVGGPMAKGSALSWRWRVATEPWRELALSPLDATVEMVMERGKVTQLDLRLPPASRERLRKARGEDG